MYRDTKCPLKVNTNCITNEWCTVPNLAYEYISIANRNIGRSRKNGGTETHVQKGKAWNGFHLTTDVTQLRRKNVSAGCIAQ
jgi:hypothetical protein